MRKLISSLFLLLPLFLQAQQTNVDSLVNVLETQKLTDDEKIELYWNIGKTFSQANYDSCIIYSHKGLLLAEKNNNKMRIATFNDLIGVSYFLKGSFDTSYIYLNKTLEIFIDLDNKQLQSKAYGNIGTMYKLKGDLEAAVDNYTKSLALNDSINRSRAVNLANLASVHRLLGHLDRAEEYLKEALGIAKELNLEYVEMGASHTLGNVYSDNREYLKARELYEKCLNLSQKLNDKQYEILSNLSLATNYAEAKDYNVAIEYGNEALRILNELGISHVDPYASLSEIYRKAKRYKESEEMALIAWNIDSTSINVGAYNAFNLALTNIHLGNKQKAEYYVLKFKDITLKGNDKQMSESLAEMEVKYETEKKEMRIAALEYERKLYIGLGIAVAAILLLGLGLLFYRHRLSVQKQKMAEQQIRQLEQEKELIAARSALDAEKAEREIIARDLHDGVGAMLSVVKNNMNIVKSYSFVENKEADYFNKALDGLEKTIVELRRVAHHIMPAILVENGLVAALDDLCRSIPEAEFHCSKSELRFDPGKELVLYRCAYELVNNVLRHANATHIDVHFNTDDDTAYLSVVDNGCGFDLQVTPQGMGINNMRTRLTVFGGSIDIFSEPGKGTEANVELRM